MLKDIQHRGYLWQVQKEDFANFYNEVKEGQIWVIHYPTGDWYYIIKALHKEPFDPIIGTTAKIIAEVWCERTLEKLCEEASFTPQNSYQVTWSSNFDLNGVIFEYVGEASDVLETTASKDLPMNKDDTRNQWFINEPDAPGLSSEVFNESFDTDLSLPDLDRKKKEDVSWEGRENLQLWTSKHLYNTEKKASPESYTDGSDINQTKEEFDNRALEFHQEDHLDVGNGRDWMWGEVDYHDFPSTSITPKLDEDKGQSYKARASLKFGVDNPIPIPSTNMAIVKHPDYYNFTQSYSIWQMNKYEETLKQLEAEGLHSGIDYIEPDLATTEDASLAHTPEYVRQVFQKPSGRRSMAWEGVWDKTSQAAVLRSAGGTIRANNEALQRGVAIQLYDAFHHAYPDHGEGFCVLNDVAIAAKKLSIAGKKVMIVDTDVHQGQGTAVCTQGDPNIYTLSTHEKENYPDTKEQSSQDVELEREVTDVTYLRLLKVALQKALTEFGKPDLVMYVAGTDLYGGDQLSSTRVTLQGIQKRDKLVFDLFGKLGVPISVSIPQGYAENPADTVSLIRNTIIAAKTAHQKYYQKQPVASLKLGLELPKGEQYPDYNLSTDIQPDEVLQHSPTVRREKTNPLKYRYDPGDEEMIFERGLHQDFNRKEVDRPMTPFGGLKFIQGAKYGSDIEETQNSQNQALSQENQPVSNEEVSQESEETIIDYPTIEEITDLHNAILASYGGLGGLTPEGEAKIEAAIGRMQSGMFDKEFYPSLVEKAAVLIHSLCTTHPFADGNKRTALMAGVKFLHLNHMTIDDSEHTADLIVRVASDEAGYEELLAWLHEHAKDLTEKFHKSLKRLTSQIQYDLSKRSFLVTSNGKIQRARYGSSIADLVQ